MAEATRYTLPTYDLSRPWPELEAQYDEQDKSYNRKKDRLRKAMDRAGRESEEGKKLYREREEILAAKRAARIHFSQLEGSWKRPPGITSWEHCRQVDATNTKALEKFKVDVQACLDSAGTAEEKVNLFENMTEVMKRAKTEIFGSNDTHHHHHQEAIESSGQSASKRLKLQRNGKPSKLVKGQRIAVYWFANDEYYPGVVSKTEKNGSEAFIEYEEGDEDCLLYTSPSPRD